MATAAEYRDKSIEELEALQGDLRKELFDLKNELSGSGKVEKPHLLKQLRRDIARALTVIAEKRKSKV